MKTYSVLLRYWSRTIKAKFKRFIFHIIYKWRIWKVFLICRKLLSFYKKILNRKFAFNLIMKILNTLYVLKSIYRNSFKLDFSIYSLISNLTSIKNTCCADIKAAFTVSSKCIIKFGYHCYYDDKENYKIFYTNKK